MTFDPFTFNTLPQIYERMTIHWQPILKFKDRHISWTGTFQGSHREVTEWVFKRDFFVDHPVWLYHYFDLVGPPKERGRGVWICWMQYVCIYANIFTDMPLCKNTQKGQSCDMQVRKKSVMICSTQLSKNKKLVCSMH